MNPEEEFRIRSTKFVRREVYDDGSKCYTYEISFNRSLEHTGRYNIMEDALNKSLKEEARKDLWFAVVRLYYSIKRYLSSLL
ncbi:hypothetical protein [Spirosoma sordidisoli]|uniref:Uncharacterized protein n=1 Tax=Spirosoma sordidisoli TaxID=2502893 RepID=A0A4V1RWA7_9BACT|nr:hypothetical protein [Spirosoma sordidisoli]RYC69608.1 hypothetical protein EQG79_13475 [Spirosoma sordidisoli]